jgi:hypothetical protein
LRANHPQQFTTAVGKQRRACGGEEAADVSIEKTFKGKYPLTICSLTKKGRQSFNDYVSKMRVVSFHSGSNGRNS